MTSSPDRNADRIPAGIALILASVAAMAFADAVVKLVSADLSLWQIFVTRAICAIPCLLALAWATGMDLRPRAIRWVVVRSMLLVATWLVYYAALPALSFSVAAVAIYTNPILTALFSAALLGERVMPRQWIGVLIGFLGVIAILRPGSEAFTWFLLLPLAGAALYSLAMIMTRAKCHEEAPAALALALHITFLVAGMAATGGLLWADLSVETRAVFPFLLDTWGVMGAREWGLMALIGALSVAFFMGVARAYQIAPPQVIGTFDYGYLVSAAIWGLVFFGERPDATTLIGMALITGAGILVAARGKG